MMHSRDVSVKNDHLHIVRGNIADRDFVDAGTRDVTRVIQMVTCKDIPELVIDVTAKGMFWLLEAFHERRGGTSCGDAAMRRSAIASSFSKKRSVYTRQPPPLLHMVEKADRAKLWMNRDEALRSFRLHPLGIVVSAPDEDHVSFVRKNTIIQGELADFVEAHPGKQRDQRHPKPAAA